MCGLATGPETASVPRDPKSRCARDCSRKKVSVFVLTSPAIVSETVAVCFPLMITTGGQMLRLYDEELWDLESSYPGIREQILDFESAVLPICLICGSADTADVQIGIVGRTITICGATTKFKLIPNGPRPGRYFCNSCRKFFLKKQKISK